MDSSIPVLIFAAFAALIIVLGILGAMAAKKRREALRALAARLGLSFREDSDHGIAERFEFLGRLAQGSNRYAFNVISGDWEGERVLVFDYHYETQSTDSKGRTTTHHHYFSFFILELGKPFAEVTIAREGLFSKIAQVFGFDDIDFESHEFSRKFCVRSRDKKLAYDVCNARMIDYLLDNTDLSIEIEREALAIGFDRRLDAAAIEGNLHRLLEVRSRLPDYLFAER